MDARSLIRFFVFSLLHLSIAVYSLTFVTVLKERNNKQQQPKPNNSHDPNDLDPDDPHNPTEPNQTKQTTGTAGQGQGVCFGVGRCTSFSGSLGAKCQPSDPQGSVCGRQVLLGGLVNENVYMRTIQIVAVQFNDKVVDVLALWWNGTSCDHRDDLLVLGVRCCPLRWRFVEQAVTWSLRLGRRRAAGGVCCGPCTRWRASCASPSTGSPT